MLKLSYIIINNNNNNNNSYYFILDFEFHKIKKLTIYRKETHDIIGLNFFS